MGKQTEHPYDLSSQPYNPDKKIPVAEIFGPTIQGEGHVAGLRTVFLRVGGCDYRCSHCDSMHAVDPKEVAQLPRYTPEEITELLLSRCLATNTPTVTISGGNPALYDLDFVQYELAKQVSVSVETQGTLWRNWLGHSTYLTVSPKGPGMGYAQSGTLSEQFEALDYFVERLHYTATYGKKRCMKVVVFGADDLEFASELIQRYKGFDHLDKFYLSVGNPLEKQTDIPIDEFRTLISEATQNIIQDVQGFPALKNARLLPQVHTLIWGQAKGV